MTSSRSILYSPSSSTTRMVLVPRITGFRLAVLLGALLALGLVTTAGAEEAKTPINASLFLSIVGAPIERREAAFDQALKEEGPPPRAPAGGPSSFRAWSKAASRQIGRAHV